MIEVSYKEVKQYESDYPFIPVAKEVLADSITPILLLRKLANYDPNYFLLESVENGEHWGRYSFLGFNPMLRLSCKEGIVTALTKKGSLLIHNNPMEVVKEYLVKYKSPSLSYLPPFTGGFVGYFSYEMYQYEEPTLSLGSSIYEDYDLYMYHQIFAYDHSKQKLIVISHYKSDEGELGFINANKDLDEMLQLIKDTTTMKEDKIVGQADFHSQTTRENYCSMVEKAKNYIKEGDIFQAVLSLRFETEYYGSLLPAYRILRTTNPSPYMYYIHNDEIEIAGASPETLVKLVDKKITTFPVAGTRPRGRNEKEDKELEEELRRDEKELAEHNMLVDLARNDIGRIAKFASVNVDEYMNIHRFSKVMHIASKVTGEIREGVDGCDAIGALLPAGTLSGAPKIRACEIIRELEPSERGIYGGAIGYLDFSGNLDVCIAIRTAMKKGDRVYVQAGAGIVSDSIPDKEYEECFNKASAVMNAILNAKEVSDDTSN